MKTNILATAAGLSDRDLLARLDVLAGREREASVELVAHLAALDSRPAAYAAEGYGSLFSYCTQALRLSEDAACSRIEVARTCRRFPAILDLLASGAMTLTSVRLLGRHLTPDNHQAVLAKACGRSRQQIEALVAELAPQPDIPSTVRKLPTFTAMPPPSAAPAPAATIMPSEPTPAIAPPTAALVPTPRPIVRPTAPERYRVQFTIGPESHEMLRRLQALLRREIPDGDQARSSTAPSPYSSKRSKRRSSERRPSRGHDRLSVPGRISQSGNPFSPRAMSRGRSSALRGGATPASVPSFLPPDGGARSGFSLNSTTFSPMRNRGRPPSRISPFAAGATTNTRPS